jgi:DNA-binding MarR family transcriptional regulator
MKIDIELIRESLRRFNRRAGVLQSDPYGVGLTLSQASALVDIGRFGQLKPNDLARLLRLDKSSVSRMLTVLEDKKLIATNDDPADRRSKNLTLTITGKKTVRVINEISDKTVSDILGLVSIHDQREIVDAFEKLSAAVEQADKDL